MIPVKKETQIRKYSRPAQSISGFNAIRFINKGTQAARVGNFDLQPGETVGWGHNVGETDIGEYTIDFPGGNLSGAEVWAIATFYKEFLT